MHRLSGVEPDSLKSEEDTFQQLEKNLYRGIRRVLRRPGKGATLQQLGQILYPRSPLLDSTKRKTMTLPRRRLLTHQSDLEVASPLIVPSVESKRPRTHTRFKSDMSAELLRVISMEEEEAGPHGECVNLLAARAASQQSVDTIQEEIVKEDEKEKVEQEMEKEEEEGEEEEEEEEEESKGQKKDPSKQPSEPLIPSIDIEVNVTINVDCGSIILHSEDVG